MFEDLHGVDPETVAVVEHLGETWSGRRCCVTTVHAEEDSPAGELARRATSPARTSGAAAGPPNDAQVAAMVHGCTGGAAAGAVGRVVELADGIPFLVEEMLVSPGLPASVADAIVSRLVQLADAHRDVLVAAAAFVWDFDWRVLAAATGLAGADVADTLDRGVKAQIPVVDDDAFRFRHTLTAEAVFQFGDPAAPRGRGVVCSRGTGCRGPVSSTEAA